MEVIRKVVRAVRGPRVRVSEPLLKDDDIALLNRHFDRDYYLNRYPDVASVDRDALEHYCIHGWKEMRDPCESFSTREFLKHSKTFTPEEGNPFLHFLKELERSGAEVPSLTEAQWLKFRFTGSVIDAVNSDENHQVFVQYPLGDMADVRLIQENMDEEFYLKEYPEVAESELSPAAHYLLLGWIKGYDPSPSFSSRYYLQNNSDVRDAGKNPFLHYLKIGQNEKWRKSLDRKSFDVILRFEKSESLRAAVNEAIDLDPMVALPSGDRVVTGPNANPDVLKVAKALRRNFADQTFKHIVLVPHVRMSGAAKIAGHYAHAVADIVGNDKALVVLCDLPVFEHPEWFPENVQVLNFAELTKDVKDGAHRGALLYDLFRGVQADTITNVNSSIAWELYRRFGRQLSQDFQLNCYLFCWEENKFGARVGYPIQWLHETVSFLTRIFCDSAFLANHVMERFGLSESTVVAALTPIEPEAIIQSGIIAAETQTSLNSVTLNSVGTILWSGRFDRQKRLDVLYAIAKRNADWTFIVYGKPVLKDKATDEVVKSLSRLPNVRMMGAYGNVGEVLDHDVDLFLYTSQYDGIPTVLLEIGELEIPIVAPDVGGVNELITDETGWLIGACDDVDAYENAVTMMLQNRELAAEKSRNLKQLLRKNHSVDVYLETLKASLAQE